MLHTGKKPDRWRSSRIVTTADAGWGWGREVGAGIRHIGAEWGPGQDKARRSGSHERQIARHIGHFPPAIPREAVCNNVALAPPTEGWMVEVLI